MTSVNIAKLVSTRKPKFVLLGSGIKLCGFIRVLLENDYPLPCIITHPYNEHLRDMKLYNNPVCRDLYESVFDLAKEYSLDLLEEKNIHSPVVSEWLEKQKPEIAFSFGCRSIIKKEFISRFNGLVFNNHDEYLPRNRGGGAGTWEILNNNKVSAVTIHWVDEEIDAGDIAIQNVFEYPSEKFYPIDIFKIKVSYNEQLGKDFLDLIESGEISKISQKNYDVTYYPNLKTEINGAINWNWATEYIERFIRAFGRPYLGAFTFCRDKKLFVERARIVGPPDSFHPYCAGLIYNIYSNNYYVATVDGALEISSLKFEGENFSIGEILKPGERLYTPEKVLEKSIIHRNIY